MWFCVIDVLIAILGIAIVPLLILDENPIYLEYGSFALIYYGKCANSNLLPRRGVLTKLFCARKAFSLVFSCIGFYGAYAIRKRYIGTLFAWLVVSFFFFFASYVGAIITVEETCREIHEQDATDERQNECVDLGQGLLIVAFIVVITMRTLFTCVGYKLFKAVKTLKEARSGAKLRSVKSTGSAGAFGRSGELSPMQPAGAQSSGATLKTPVASSATMHRGDSKQFLKSADFKRNAV